MSKPGISNTYRALWMVLITSLAAPFVVAVIEVAMTLASPLLDFALPPRNGAALGEVALRAFSWGAMPATIAALGLVPFVLERGTYGWLHAAVAGVLAFMAAVIIAPINAGPAMPFLAFLAGLVAIGMRAFFIRVGILAP